MWIRRGKRSSSRQTLGFGTLAVTALVFGAVGMMLSTAAQGAPKPGTPDLIAQLECGERSRTDTGKVAYEITDPPVYPEGHRPADSPEAVAAEAAGDLRALARAPRRVETYRSSDRVDFALEDADGRVVAFVTTVDDGGWRFGGGVSCAVLR